MAQIQYILQDGNVAEPMNSQFSFTVTVLNETDSVEDGSVSNDTVVQKDGSAES